MCQVFEISESGYYRWLKNKSKPKARELLSVKIQAILDKHTDNDNYGVNRMKSALEQEGIIVSKRTVYRAMSEMKLLHRRRTSHGTTKATTEIQEQENLIKRDFTAEKPLRKLLSDITEIQCYDGKLYLSAVLDCYNGEILSVAMDNNMKKELCIRTVKELKIQYGKRRLAGAIFHSDRGCQYTSEAFRTALKDAGLIQSLSGVGHCFDNARMESFFATLKKEKIYRIAAYKMTREEVKSIIFRYIFVYYNRIRVTTFNPKGLSPVAYREWARANLHPAA
jgi:transposase InsO family protein